MAAARNSVGYELSASLIDAFADRVTEAPAIAERLAGERLQAHREFVRERQQQGETLGYEADNYEFPVMTQQERHIQLREIESVEETVEGYRVEHEPV
jgi:hypothetical protein